MFLRNTALTALCAGVLVVAPLLMSGSSTKAAAALVILFAPLAIFLALKRPMLFPYAAYAFLIPFDNLLSVSTFGTATRLLGLCAGVALLWWTMRQRRIVSPPRTLLVCAALVAWAGLTLVWTSDFSGGLRVFGTILQIMLLYAVLSITPIEVKQIQMVLLAIVGGGFVAAIFGLYIFHHQSPVQQELQRELGRLQIQIGESAIDVNHFANALMLPIAATLVMALNQRRIVAKLFLCGVLATMIGAVYASASREALLGIGAMAVYLAIVSRKRLQLLAVFALGAFLSVLNPAVWQRFAAASATGGAGRTSIWAVGIAALKAHWLFGSGIGSFTNAYDQAYIGVFQSYPVGWSRDAHDILLSSSVELGIIGVLLVVTLWVMQFFMLRRIERGSALYDMRMICMAALIGLSLCAFFIDLFTYKYLWLLFALIAQVRSLAVLHSELAVRPTPVTIEEDDVADPLWVREAPSHAY
ncbi:MAG: O-antigen ligase family protein [Candidatus Eremiobacteraeota bacterium]|nr:O-antigen ligase family protein [Candidatus Eremiobacteraeota bacterium]